MPPSIHTCSIQVARSSHRSSVSPSCDQKVTSLDLPLADATREFQRDYIQRQIDRVRGNMTSAAEQLGLQRSNLYRKMKLLDMSPADM
jgi:DNA-binding NtrC family response regulator